MLNGPKVFEAIFGSDLTRLKNLIDGDLALATARNEMGVSALMTAAYVQNSEMVDVLREKIETLDVFEAAALGDTVRVQQCLSGSGGVNQRSGDGFTALHLAAFFGQFIVAKLLIELGADVQSVAENPSCVQPLHSAAACGSAAIVRILLDGGADPNATQHGGWTALQSAAKHGNRELVTLLLQKGADPNQAAETGETALALSKDEEIRSLLTDDITRNQD